MRRLLRLAALGLLLGAAIAVEATAAPIASSTTIKFGTPNGSASCFAVNGTVSDPGDGSRVITGKDNTTGTVGAAASGAPKLFSVANEWCMRNNSSGEKCFYRAGGVDVATLDGGTGGSYASVTALFNGIDPLTTKGDAGVNDGTNTVRQAVGADGTVWTADSAQTNGVKYSYPLTPWTAAVTGSDFTKSTTGMGSVTGLSYTIAQGVNYIITGQFRLDASAGTADPQIRFNVSGTGPTVLIGFHCANEGSTAVNSITQNAATTGTTITISGATTWTCLVSGRITGPTSGGSGTGTLDVGPTGTGTDTVYIGSYLTVAPY